MLRDWRGSVMDELTSTSTIDLNRVSKCDLYFSVLRLQEKNFALESQLQEAQAELSSLKGCANLLEETLRQKALLVEEVAALRADNAALIDSLDKIGSMLLEASGRDELDAIQNYINDTWIAVHPGDSLLKELGQLRAVKAAAEAAINWMESGGWNTEQTHWRAVKDALAAANGGD